MGAPGDEVPVLLAPLHATTTAAATQKNRFRDERRVFGGGVRMRISCLIAYRAEIVVGGAHRAPRTLSLPLMIALAGSPQLHSGSRSRRGGKTNFRST